MRGEEACHQLPQLKRRVVSAEMSRYHGLSQHVDFDQLAAPGQRFTLEQVVGEGTYGEVYCARDQDTGNTLVKSSIMRKK